MITNIRREDFKLENYEGPLDLLLDLIKNKKMSINEISLLEVVDQFIYLVNNSDVINLNDFSEYLLLSSELLAIKSKYILQKENDEGSVFEDKKTKRLLHQLLEYEKYKNLSEKIFQIYKKNINVDKLDDDLDNFIADNSTIEYSLKKHSKEDIEKAIYNISTNKKMNKINTTLKIKRISVEQRREQLIKFFKENNNINFLDLIKDNFSIYMISVTLLCLLEMANSQIIKIKQIENNQLFIERM